MTPALSQRLPDLTPREPIHAIPNFSYRVQNYTGKGYLCIGDAHRFIDPIFAYGVYFGIQEGEFAAEAIAGHLAGEMKTNGNPFADFETALRPGQRCRRRFHRRALGISARVPAHRDFKG